MKPISFPFAATSACGYVRPGRLAVSPAWCRTGWLAIARMGLDGAAACVRQR